MTDLSTMKVNLIEIEPTTCASFLLECEKRYAIFEARFQDDPTKIVIAANKGRIVLYDLTKEHILLKSETAHFNLDVNQVCPIHHSVNFLSCGDDGHISIWDPRQNFDLGSVGSFIGHLEGVTSIDVTQDGRYLSSVSKD